VTAYREGRLELAPATWLAHLRNYHRELGRARAPAPPPLGAPASGDVKAVVTQLYTAMLRTFLASGARLALPAAAEPAVSIAIAVHNRAELVLRGLRSIAEHGAVPLEVILVDNVSTDATGLLFDRLDGARILRNPTNVGFLGAINQAARLARGRALLVLNSDVELLPGSLAAALELLDRDETIGAVGGPVVLLDGRLQEAGSIIWRDGSCTGYGRGDDPLAPPYMFQRDVDYCSAAFLLTRRAPFLELGGFDEAYAPMYYEDSDYCARLWQRGRRVVYDPRAAVVHFEFASSTSTERAVELQRERRRRFVARHGAWLEGQPRAGDARAVLGARARPPAGRRILVLDDRVPHTALGAGNPRARTVLAALERLGHAVTLRPLSVADETWAEVYADLPRTIEVVLGRIGLAQLLDERRGSFDLIWVSRAHNLQRLRAALGGAVSVPVIYDTEALGALRAAASDAALERELALAASARVVVAVSRTERDRLARATAAPCLTLGHALTVQPTPRPFEARAGLLFVGALGEEGSPNVDGVVWFCAEVLPRLRALVGPVELDLVGATELRDVRALAARHAGVRVLGALGPAELDDRYDRARVFVAPARFAAGLPHKVHEAAARGLPVVTTSILAAQLEWQDGVELGVADSADGLAAACARLLGDGAAWAQQRAQALARVATDCAPERFERTVAEIVRLALA
jgi:GT2 family glycosyltransferase